MEHTKNAELSVGRTTTIDGLITNRWTNPGTGKPLDKVKELPRQAAGSVRIADQKRVRNVPINIWCARRAGDHSERMAEAGIRNMTPISEKWRWAVMCSTLTFPRSGAGFPAALCKQSQSAAIHANSYGFYPDELKQLQRTMPTCGAAVRSAGPALRHSTL
ncbi:MAG: hypothetical protein ACLRJV_14350 [Eubacteriales bacterium]